jgi:hypothetical protein
VKGAGGSVNFDGLIKRANDADGSVGAEVDCCSADGGEKGPGQFAGVEAVLFEKDEATVAGDKLREEMGQLCDGECVGRGGAFVGECLQGGVGLEADVETGEIVEAGEIVGIEGGAEA